MRNHTGTRVFPSSFTFRSDSWKCCRCVVHWQVECLTSGVPCSMPVYFSPQENLVTLKKYKHLWRVQGKCFGSWKWAQPLVSSALDSPQDELLQPNLSMWRESVCLKVQYHFRAMCDWIWVSFVHSLMQPLESLTPLLLQPQFSGTTPQLIQAIGKVSMFVLIAWTLRPISAIPQVRFCLTCMCSISIRRYDWVSAEQPQFC